MLYILIFFVYAVLDTFLKIQMSNINLNTSFFACNLFAKYIVSMHCFIVYMEILSRKIADVFSQTGHNTFLFRRASK